MKNKSEIDRRANARAPTEKLNLHKHLVGLWRGLEDNQHWKFDELSPVQLLEKLNLKKHPTDKDELARAEFFGVAGHACFRQPAILFGLFRLLGCQSGYSFFRR